MRPSRIFVSALATVFAFAFCANSRAQDGANAASPAPNPGASSPAQSPANSGKPSEKTAQAPEQKLPPVVVTATRIEQPVSEVGTTTTVVESDQIESQKIQTVADVLRQVPGVFVTQSGSPGTVTDVSIRGSTPSQTLIMADGVELNNGNTGQFNLANLTTEGLDRIEVVRGAGGALYGSQAIGGAINLITAEGEGAPKASLLAEGGNRASERQVMTVSGAEGKLGYSGVLSYFSTEGFQKLNDNSDNLSGAVRLDYHLDDDTTLRGFARYFRSNVSLVDLNNFAEAIDPNAHQREEFMLFNGVIEHRFNEHLSARANAYFLRDDIRINDLPEPAFPSTQIARIPDEVRGGNTEAVISWVPGWRTVIGFDFKDRWARTYDLFAFPGFSSLSIFRARRQEYAGYVEQEGSALDGRILATAGFRADGNSQFGEEVSPAWSLVIPVKEINTSFRGSYSEGFRAPSFDELYFPSFGNAQLSPEISSEYDGGFTTQFAPWANFTATYFSRRVHNLIVAVPVTPSPTFPFGSMAGNAGRVDVQGIELVPSLGPWSGFSFSGGFTILDETHVSVSPNTRPLRVPKRSAYGLAQYVRRGLLREDDSVALSLAYTFVGDRDDITTASTITSHDAYHRFDATALYDGRIRWGIVSDEQVFARVQNLFDRHYSEAFGFPAPPVNFMAGLKADFD